MKDEEFVGKLGKLWKQLMEEEKDEDYEVNPEQAVKFQTLVEFFTREVEKQRGEMDPIELIPKQCRGDVTVYFLDFTVRGRQVAEFCDLMRNCSVFGFDSLGDGRVCLSCTIPDVFVRKKE